MAGEGRERRMTGPQSAVLGRRLHLQHGPIDLIVESWGDESEIEAAYRQAATAFETVLQTLVDELPQLRREAHGLVVQGQVAKRMVEATERHEAFVTPMAAVAGSVADHILAATLDGRTLAKASVNNGGDIALWLGGKESLTIGVGDVRNESVTLTPVMVQASDGIGGVATSGWGGRSHSLGVAEFVTVFAKDAATADVAATLIGNAVDVPTSDQIKRVPALQLSPDSDLGSRMVTVEVGALSETDISSALMRGQSCAEKMLHRGLINAVVLGLQGQRKVVGSGMFMSSLERTETLLLKNVEMTGGMA